MPNEITQIIIHYGTRFQNLRVSLAFFLSYMNDFKRSRAYYIVILEALPIPLVNSIYR